MKPGPVLRALFAPLAGVYGAIVGARNRMYENGRLEIRRLDAAVISVGNITAGGTGKTPMVQWIAERLLAEGRSAGVLSRGYKGESNWSDEVALLRERLGERVKVMIDRERARSGEWMAERGWKYLLLDDGFQHRRLARDADVVLIDCTDPFGGGQLLPAGRLREPVSSLARADAVVITRSEQAPELEETIRRYTPAPIFYATTRIEGVHRAHLPGVMVGRESCEMTAADANDAQQSAQEILRLPAIGEPLPAWKEMKWFAFCGLGNPRAFFADLHAWGARIVGEAPFADHHTYTAAGAEELGRRAVEAGADGLLCTEKDFYNHRGVASGPLPVYVARIRMQVHEGERFWHVLKGIVEKRRPGAFQ